jgi:hypothetical protein
MRSWIVVVLAVAACRGRGDVATVDAAASAQPVVASAVSAEPSAVLVPSASAEPSEPAPTSASSHAPPPRSTDTKPTFRKANVDAAALAHAFASIPELERVSADVRLFDPNEGAFFAHSDAPRAGMTFTTQPLFYSPAQGLELLVVTGRSKSTGFVVALWVLPNGEYRLASYFLMLHDPSPIALVYETEGKSKRLSWTACWKCPGEGGYLRIEPDDRVVIVAE